MRPLLRTEFNIEGYPSPDFIDLVLKVKPHQVTLVPDAPSQITSNSGWDTKANLEFLTEVLDLFNSAGIRTSVFVAADPEMVEYAAKAGADRVELYTEPYATDYPKNPEAAIAPFIEAAKTARRLGIGLNAGHDLSLVNLNYFYKNIPWVDEVSIGHALISDALYLGLERTVQEYKTVYADECNDFVSPRAVNMADSLATANPVLTEVNAPEMNMLDMAVKGGWIMIVLGLLSVVCFYILFERNYMIRKAGKEDPMFMERIKDYIHSGEIKAAINYCRTMNTPSARMIEKGISRLGRPINDVQAAIENVGNIEVAKLEKGLTVMATISGGAPMLGFLGTVTGMVRAFYEMANAGSGNIDITLLSGGIYEAMITTVGGLIVGIIAMFAYNYLVMLVDRVVNKMESRTMEFMDLLNEPT